MRKIFLQNTLIFCKQALIVIIDGIMIAHDVKVARQQHVLNSEAKILLFKSINSGLILQLSQFNCSYKSLLLPLSIYRTRSSTAHFQPCYQSTTKTGNHLYELIATCDCSLHVEYKSMVQFTSNYICDTAKLTLQKPIHKCTMLN